MTSEASLASCCSPETSKIPAGDISDCFQTSKTRKLGGSKEKASSHMAAKYLKTPVCQKIYMNQQSFPDVDWSGENWTLEERLSGLLYPGKK